jgi:hypothetical protein
VTASATHRAALRRSREVDCVIAPRPRNMLRAAVALGVATLVAAAAWLHGWRMAHDLLAPTSGTDPGVALRQQLGEADAALKMEQSRSRELERQIDALNKRLVESQEQLTFLRKSRGEKP